MEFTNSIDLNIAERLQKDQEFRRAFFHAQARDEISSQIFEFREKAKLTKQTDFAEACGMKQSAVSRMEKHEYSSWTFNTLIRIAEALNARWRFVLQSTSDAVAEYRRREQVDISDLIEVQQLDPTKFLELENAAQGVTPCAVEEKQGTDVLPGSSAFSEPRGQFQPVVIGVGSLGSTCINMLESALYPVSTTDFVFTSQALGRTCPVGQLYPYDRSNVANTTNSTEGTRPTSAYADQLSGVQL